MTGSAPSGTLSRPKRWPRRSPITPGIAVIRLSYHQPIVKPEPKCKSAWQACQSCTSSALHLILHLQAPPLGVTFVCNVTPPLGVTFVCNVAGRAHVG